MNGLKFDNTYCWVLKFNKQKKIKEVVAYFDSQLVTQAITENEPLLKQSSQAPGSDLKGDFGFIGLGMMGYPMARNLASRLPKSSKLYIFDVNNTALDKFVKEFSGTLPDIKISKSAREVTENAQTIVSMLPEDSHVRSVYMTAETGALAAKSTSSARKLFLDCSTIDTVSSLAVRDAVLKSSLGEFADCPVSGGVMGAEAATLSFMVGSEGDAEIFSRIKPVLSCMGKSERIFPCGPAGSGLGAKLSNNYLAGVTTLVTAEAMNLGIRLGLDPKNLAKIFSVSTGQNFITDKNNPVPGVTAGAPAERDYQGGFRIALAKKDLGLAREAAHK